jgi:hypothetical protein
MRSHAGDRKRAVHSGVFYLTDFGAAPMTSCERIVEFGDDSYATQVGGSILPNSDQIPSA